MANGIAVTPERLREVSAQVGAGAAEVDAILSRLTTAVAPIRSEWVGAAQVQFEALWNQLQQDASGVQAVLSGIAKLTQNAATAYTATEQSIANSFNEFPVEMDEISEKLSQVQQILTSPAPAPETLDNEADKAVEEDLNEETLNGADGESVDGEKVVGRPPWNRSNGRRKVEEELIDQH